MPLHYLAERKGRAEISRGAAVPLEVAFAPGGPRSRMGHLLSLAELGCSQVLFLALG